MREAPNGRTGTARCASCELEEGETEAGRVMLPFDDCSLSKEMYASMEENDGRASASGKRVRSTKAPSRGTKATRGAAALDGEVSDEMYWTMVKASQRVGAEASTTSFLDDQAVLDDGGMTLETEAFINGLIRFPSMLDLDANNLHRSISASLDHGFVAADDDFDGPRSMRMRSPTPPDIVLAGVDALFAPTSSDSRHRDQLEAFLAQSERNDSLYGFGSAPEEMQQMVYQPDSRLMERVQTSQTGAARKTAVRKKRAVPASASTTKLELPPRDDSFSKLPGGADRRKVLERYHEKRKSRQFNRTVLYEGRKARAETRVRIGGRFAKSEDGSQAKKARGSRRSRTPVPA